MLPSVFSNPIFLMSLAVVTGVFVGKIRVGRISLGLSGALFTGLALGLSGCRIPAEYFSWNLVIFVVCVGLLASEDIVRVVRLFGLKFALLGVLVTGVGALVTFLLGFFAGGSADPFLVAGTYTGALTSSPGLGAALEATGGNPLVIAGYTVAYPFGVIAVVLFVQLAPVIFGIDVEKERTELGELIRPQSSSEEDREESSLFSLASFTFCVSLGLAVGSLKIHIPGLGAISLGSTGGSLLFALFAGALGRLGPFSMRMDRKVLSALRSLSLAYFLATAGLMAGPKVIVAIRDHGLVLIAIGLGAAVLAELAGFFVGRYLWRINWVLLSGAICGAMTSTPGLGAAIDATGTEDCASGYGATYPVAIVCMVIFTTLIYRGLALIQ